MGRHLRWAGPRRVYLASEGAVVPDISESPPAQAGRGGASWVRGRPACVNKPESEADVCESMCCRNGGNEQRTEAQPRKVGNVVGVTGAAPAADARLLYAGTLHAYTQLPPPSCRAWIANPERTAERHPNPTRVSNVHL